MLFAIIKKTQQPIKIISWTYIEPGKLSEVHDSTGKTWEPWKLIPIGYKTYRKMMNEFAIKNQMAELKAKEIERLKWVTSASDKEIVGKMAELLDKG